jgi:hypothetical protein
LSAKSVNKLQEADIKEMLNTDNVAPVVHSLSDGEIPEMVLNTDKHEDSNSDDDNTILLLLLHVLFLRNFVFPVTQIFTTS